jgi:hypothetical protein
MSQTQGHTEAATEGQTNRPANAATGRTGPDVQVTGIRTASSPGGQGYDTELAYMEDALKWVDARMRRIIADVRLNTLRSDSVGCGPRRRRPDDNDASPSVLRARREHYGRLERRLSWTTVNDIQ